MRSESTTWWDSLTEEEREKAFYAVISRMYQAEVKERGSYRYALYDVFRFNMSMYAAGMDCGYMELHNALFDAEEYRKMRDITRFEVVDDMGRAYVKYLGEGQKITYSLQDCDSTLKVFIDKEKGA